MKRGISENTSQINQLNQLQSLQGYDVQRSPQEQGYHQNTCNCTEEYTGNTVYLLFRAAADMSTSDYNKDYLVFFFSPDEKLQLLIILPKMLCTYFSYSAYACNTSFQFEGIGISVSSG